MKSDNIIGQADAKKIRKPGKVFKLKKVDALHINKFKILEDTQ